MKSGNYCAGTKNPGGCFVINWNHAGSTKKVLMMIRAITIAAALAATLSLGVPANAAPLGPAKAVDSTATQTQPVHYRGYRHCHRWGCHGRRYSGYRYRSYGYDYGYRPGIYLRFGGGDRHYRRRHWR
jgi:hypothetical protein